MKVSFTNKMAAATITASSSDSVYVAANVKKPEQRYNPWRSTVVTNSWIKFDFGSAQSVQLFEFIRANFTTATLYGHASDLGALPWGGASYQQALTLTQNPFNGQYTLAHVPTAGVPFSFRWGGLYIPTQSAIAIPNVSGSSGFFMLGGIWAGATVTVPTGFSVDFDHINIEPKIHNKHDQGAWREILRSGEKLVALRRKRQARFSHFTPYVSGDEARDWLLNVDEAAWQATIFALYEELGNTAMAWIVQTTSDSAPWNVAQPGVVGADWELEEVVGP